jgi:hypothetical protein
LSIIATTSAETPKVTHIRTTLASALRAASEGDTAPRLLIEAGQRVDPLDQRELELFEQAAPPELLADGFWQNMRSHGRLDSREHSGSARILIDLVREFISRIGVEGFPLMIDDDFNHLDGGDFQFFARLVCAIGRRSQVIVGTWRHTNDFPESKVIRHLTQERSIQAIAYYKPAVRRIPPQKSSTRVRPKTFRLNQTFLMPENKVCELKEVKEQNPVSTIGHVIDQYVVAFLNAGIEQTGSIFWGVTNGTRTVVGVPLTDKQCDEVRRVVVDKVGSIVPPIALTTLSIKLHPLVSKSPIPLYVVEVKVPAIHGKYLHATGSGEVYVKTEAGKKKLTIMQIQQELLRRNSRV